MLVSNQNCQCEGMTCKKNFLRRCEFQPGTLLVVGSRGVGKTTFVQHALCNQKPVLISACNQDSLETIISRLLEIFPLDIKHPLDT